MQKLLRGNVLAHTHISSYDTAYWFDFYTVFFEHENWQWRVKLYFFFFALIEIKPTCSEKKFMGIGLMNNNRCSDISISKNEQILVI